MVSPDDVGRFWPTDPDDLPESDERLWPIDQVEGGGSFLVWRDAVAPPPPRQPARRPPNRPGSSRRWSALAPPPPECEDAG